MRLPSFVDAREGGRGCPTMAYGSIVIDLMEGQPGDLLGGVTTSFWSQTILPD
ncbi:MAG: hypothetical protein IKP44_05365 [Bacteroidaceae bacterium]|nr:hypothetical protein [Bacteroidaceae bacterium]